MYWFLCIFVKAINAKNMSTKCTILYKQIEIFKIVYSLILRLLFSHDFFVLFVLRNFLNHNNCLIIDNYMDDDFIYTMGIHEPGMKV